MRAWAGLDGLERETVRDNPIKRVKYRQSDGAAVYQTAIGLILCRGPDENWELNNRV